MNEGKMSGALHDDALENVIGGVYTHSIYADKTVDPNQRGCREYRCNSCGATKGAHAADCSAGRPDCCGSCIYAGKQNGNLVCGGAVSGK